MSGIGWVRVLMTVPEELREAANMAATELDFDAGGELTFDVPLGPPGAAAPTDFGAYTLMRRHTLDEILAVLLPAFAGARVYSELGGWDQASGLADAGLVVLAGGGA